MNPLVHGELSWLVGHRLEARRDRLLVTLAGVLPDLDGLTLLAGEDAYGRWHHLITHGFVAALLICGALTVFARRRVAVFGLTLVAFHLHLLCDLAGSGVGWPLFYGWPFSTRALGWAGGWELASWQNSVIGFIATLAVLACAVTSGRTIVELFSARAEREVVQAIRRRFVRPNSEG